MLAMVQLTVTCPPACTVLVLKERFCGLRFGWGAATVKADETDSSLAVLDWTRALPLSATTQA